MPTIRKMAPTRPQALPNGLFKKSRSATKSTQTSAIRKSLLSNLDQYCPIALSTLLLMETCYHSRSPVGSERRYETWAVENVSI